MADNAFNPPASQQEMEHAEMLKVALLLHFKATARLYQGVTTVLAPFLAASPLHMVERAAPNLVAGNDTRMETETCEGLVNILNARTSSTRLVIAVAGALLPYMADNPRDLLGALAQPAAEFRDVPLLSDPELAKFALVPIEPGQRRKPPAGSFAELAQSFSAAAADLLRRNEAATVAAIDDINDVYAEDLTIVRKGYGVTLYLVPSTVS